VETLGAARLAKDIPARRAVAAIIPREEIAAVLRDPESSPELLLRITGDGLDDSDESNMIAMAWSRDDLAGVLERAAGENVVLTFDRDELSQAIGDVEAHGLRQHALVFAVAATGALGTGAAIANAMPTNDDGGPVVASVAPALSAASSMTDVSSGAGYTAPVAGAAASGAGAMVSDAASAAGYSAPVADAAASGAGAMISDAASAAGYSAPVASAGSAADARITDVSSAGGYTAVAPDAGVSAAGARVTDASSSGGYGAVASTGSSGEFLGIHESGTTDGLLAAGIVLAIAGATFAARHTGTPRPA
jgi:hypothetical protein